jgi:hypothetical protein
MGERHTRTDERHDYRAHETASARRESAGSRTWGEALREGVATGAVASLFSAAALALLGRLESGAAAGPLNGPSQWLWGRLARHESRPSARHTLAGFLVHHVSASGWAVLHEKLFGGRGRSAWRDAALTAAVASFVDYRVAPRRLQPGFEAHLSRPSLLLVYGAFAAGLAVRHLRRR